MEQALLQLLEDFHSGNLRAFGWYSFNMKNKILNETDNCLQEKIVAWSK